MTRLGLALFLVLTMIVTSMPVWAGAHGETATAEVEDLPAEPEDVDEDVDEDADEDADEGADDPATALERAARELARAEAKLAEALAKAAEKAAEALAKAEEKAAKELAEAEEKAAEALAKAEEKAAEELAEAEEKAAEELAEAEEKTAEALAEAEEKAAEELAEAEEKAAEEQAEAEEKAAEELAESEEKAAEELAEAEEKVAEAAQKVTKKTVEAGLKVLKARIKLAALVQPSDATLLKAVGELAHNFGKNLAKTATGETAPAIAPGVRNEVDLADIAALIGAEVIGDPTTGDVVLEIDGAILTISGTDGIRLNGSTLSPEIAALFAGSPLAYLGEVLRATVEVDETRGLILVIETAPSAPAGQE